MAGLRKLSKKSDRPYYARIWWWSDNGKRHEKLVNLKTSNKSRAEELLPEIEKQEKLFKQGIIEIDDIKVREPTSLKKMIDEFFEYLQASDRSPKTLSLYDLALNKTLLVIYPETNIEMLTKDDYTNFIKEIRKQYPNNVTANIRLRSIRAFFNWCLENDKIKRIPFKIKKLPTKRKKPRYFSDDEMERILAEVESHKILYARIWVHWKTGLRLRELSNSYYENGFIKTYDAKKNGLERSIPIDKKTREQYFVAKESSLTPGHISRMFTKLLRELNLYITKHGDKRHFHNLRATFAVKKYYETRDIYRVKILLGHSEITTTEKYAQFDIAELEQDFNLTINNKNITMNNGNTDQRNGKNSFINNPTNQMFPPYSGIS